MTYRSHFLTTFLAEKKQYPDMKWVPFIGERYYDYVWFCMSIRIEPKNMNSFLDSRINIERC
jgi:hypothetical protein